MVEERKKERGRKSSFSPRSLVFFTLFFFSRLSVLFSTFSLVYKIQSSETAFLSLSLFLSLPS